MSIIEVDLQVDFIADIRNIIAKSRNTAIRSVDFERVQMYRKLGERIVIEEQGGKERADYGTYLVQNLAMNIEADFESGFSYRKLAFCQQE